MDTIYALSTAEGKAGVAIIRVSGEQAFEAVHNMCGPLPKPHYARLRTIRDKDGAVIDKALILTFPENQSFTGEKTVEIHAHGSVAILRSIQDILSRQPNLRQAEPGEFTRRALDNGRLNLTQVEGLADLIEAETDAQRVQAQRVFQGELGKKVDSWREQLIRASALIEATIDFADEEIPENVFPEVGALLENVQASLKQELAGSQISERIRTGFEVAIIGQPNVGKSTLLNRLAGRDAAITCEIAGTTRDVIEVRMDLNGLPVTLLDTAGLRETKDLVESVGIDRTRQRAEQADLRVVLVEKGKMPDIKLRKNDLIVSSKADIINTSGLAISGKTGQGVAKLVKYIGQILSERVVSSGLAIRERHRLSMTEGLSAVESALQDISLGLGEDVVAEEIRIAIRKLDSIIGRVDVEMVLDEIFSNFCLGK